MSLQLQSLPSLFLIFAYAQFMITPSLSFPLLPAYASTKRSSRQIFRYTLNDSATHKVTHNAPTSTEIKSINDNDDDEKMITKVKNVEQQISDLCQSINNLMKGFVIEPVRNYVQIQPSGTAAKDVLSKLTAPPEDPGIPRPVWLTILGSVPTLLVWYGYYKFSVEEELYQHELRTTNRVSGCGGYGTLFPFVFGILIGYPLEYFHVPGGSVLIEASVLWILLGQINLYRRVNELCSIGGKAAEEMGLVEPPLHSWWAVLPPPLDVVVGLRQVHFLSEYWRITRNEDYEKDVIAEDLFPFISTKRITLKKFFRTPSIWFWFTKDWKDFEFEFLKDNY